MSIFAEGKAHDKKLADDEGYRFPSGSKLLQDTVAKTDWDIDLSRSLASSMMTEEPESVSIN